MGGGWRPSPLTGPTFWKDGVATRLIRTTNLDEDLAEGGTVATVTFVSGNERARYRIVARTAAMRLEFAAEGMPFEMARAWKHRWGDER